MSLGVYSTIYTYSTGPDFLNLELRDDQLEVCTNRYWEVDIKPFNGICASFRGLSGFVDTYFYRFLESSAQYMCKESEVEGSHNHDRSGIFVRFWTIARKLRTEEWALGCPFTVYDEFLWIAPFLDIVQVSQFAVIVPPSVSESQVASVWGHFVVLVL